MGVKLMDRPVERGRRVKDRGLHRKDAPVSLPTGMDLLPPVMALAAAVTLFTVLMLSVGKVI